MKQLQILTLCALFCFTAINSQAQCAGASASFSTFYGGSPNSVYLNAVVVNSPHSNNPYEYTWVINGQTYNGQYLTYQASSSGAYSACLTIVDTFNSCTITTYCDSILATNPCASYSVDFTTTTTANGGVTFTPNVTNGTPFYTASWDFGDGDFASNSGTTVYDQSHTYGANGLYMACLTVSDTNNCSATYCDSLLVTNATTSNPCAGASASFSSFYGGSPNSVYLNAVVANSPHSNNPYEYTWVINGQSYNGQYLIYQAPSSGAYSACLTITDTLNGCTITTYCDSILATNPCASYSVDFTTTTTANGGVTFTPNITNGTPFYTASWDFGDGDFAGNSGTTVYDQSHTYANNGTYSACLSVSDTNGCSATYCDSLVTVSNVGGTTPCSGVSIDFNFTQDSTNLYSLDLTPVITGANTSGGFDFVWSFGDNTGSTTSATPSHQYGNTGSYVICLTVIDTVFNCSFTYCDTINMDSLGNFSRSGFVVNVLPAQFNTITSVVDKEAYATSEIQLFPNPVSNELNIKLTSPITTNAQVTVLNINGQAVLSQVVNVTEGEQQLALSVNELPAGMYLLRMQGEQLQHTQKFIKQ